MTSKRCILTKSSLMIILAIDPGYERVGLAILEKKSRESEKLIYSNCFITERSLDFSNRLVLIGKETERIIKTYKPQALAIEKLFFHTNQKTAMRVSEVRGAIIFIASLRNLTIYEYTPQKIKAAITGYGKGGKEQVTAMVRNLIVIDKEIAYDDEYDAIAIGLTCLAVERF